MPMTHRRALLTSALNKVRNSRAYPTLKYGLGLGLTGGTLGAVDAVSRGEDLEGIQDEALRLGALGALAGGSLGAYLHRGQPWLPKSYRYTANTSPFNTAGFPTAGSKYDYAVKDIPFVIGAGS